MSSVLVCLLSEQHIPNLLSVHLLSVHHFQPDHLLLVESGAMQRRRAAERFLEALRLGELEYQARHRVIPLRDETRLSLVREDLQQAFHTTCSQLGPTEWIVNLTGGTKPMSIAAYDLFQSLRRQAVDSPHIRLIYTFHDRPDQFLDLQTNQAETTHYRPSLRQFLAGYGFEIVVPKRVANRQTLRDWRRAREKTALSRWEAARLVAAHLGGEPLVTQPFHDRWQEERNRLSSRRWRNLRVTLNRQEFCRKTPQLVEPICRALGLDPSPSRHSWELDNAKAEWLAGGWLEEFFFGLLHRHAEALDVWDPWLNLRVRPMADDQPSRTDNEFDVAFMRHYTLHCLECKSGAQARDPQADVLYKIEAVVRQFRALRVRPILATTGGNVLDRNSGGLKPHLAERAALYDCRVLVRDQVGQLAREGPEKPELVRQLLF